MGPLYTIGIVVRKRLVLSVNRRWYDKGPHITQAFAGLTQLPDPYQQTIGHIVLSVSRNLHDANTRTHSLKSLGAERTTSLIKAREARRAEDNSPHLCKAFQYLAILTDPQRMRLAVRISMSYWCVREYQTACQRNNREEQFKEAMTIIQVAFERGLSYAKQCFEKINMCDADTEAEFKRLADLFNQELVTPEEEPTNPLAGVGSNAQAPKEDDKGKNKLKQKEGGMRIRHQDGP